MTHTTHPFSDHDVVDDHLGEERLVDLALADPPLPAESAHLATCRRCEESLKSLRRTIELTRVSATLDLIAPPRDLWQDIAHEIEREDDSDREVEEDHDDLRRDEPTAANRADVVPLMPASRRHASADTSSRRRPALGWLAAACLSGVLLGAGGLLVKDQITQTPVPPTRTLATAELDTLNTGQRLGSATVSERDGGVTLQVSARDLSASSDGYVEVWLINRDGKRLVSVGVLAEGAQTGSFPISSRLLDEGYVVVDISRELFNDEPQHSGDSLVRGELTTPT